ncbi:uncharacterized protein LOC144480425 isoform X2 [Mustelus asterias]
MALHKPFAIKMQSSAIQWTAGEYSLKEFLRKFQTSLPKIVKVTEGFLGRQEVDTLSASTVLRIHCLFSQKRAIVECKNGSILSIPVNLKSMMFNVLDQKHKTGELLIRHPTVIPMYMKEIKLVIAEGFSSKDETEWNTLCDYYNKVVNDIGNLDHFIFTDIALLDKDKLDQYTGEYAEIEPIYIDLYSKNLEQECQVVQTRQSLAEAANDDLVQSRGEHKPQVPPRPNTETSSSRYVAAPALRIKPFFKFSRRSNYVPTEKAKRIVSMGEVPDDLQHLSVDEVCDCLQVLNMGKYIEAFRAQQIDGHLLFDLDRDIMHNTLGMNNFHIIKMIRFREGWRPK